MNSYIKMMKYITKEEYERLIMLRREAVISRENRPDSVRLQDITQAQLQELAEEDAIMTGILSERNSAPVGNFGHHREYFVMKEIELEINKKLNHILKQINTFITTIKTKL